MKYKPYKTMILSTVLMASLLSSCANKVVIESDHKHPHIHHRHPHERPEPRTDITIKP